MVGSIEIGVMFEISGGYREAMWGLVVISFAMEPIAFLMSAPKYLHQRKAQAGVEAPADVDR